ncbi:IclR family transcriptional regulator [Roseibium sp.]|uniref:IclR family transcriptional regulator n=1 Tax=Roseibium sp. TaxID=1936156 RepID=UPI003A96CACF
MDQQASGDGTVGKALDVLDRVAEKERPVRFAELLSESDHPKATLYRLLQTLVSQGMLSYRPEDQTYSLGMRLMRLAHKAWQRSSLAPIARPFVDELSRTVGETIHLAQLDGAQVLYVDKRNAVSPVEMYSQAGKVGPSYCTGVGKAMLAFLPEPQLTHAIEQQSFYGYTEHTLTTEEDLRVELEIIRDSGIAFDREEHETGIICIAAPILSRSGRPMGALSITTSTKTKSFQHLRELQPVLTETAERISKAAADWQFPG